MDIGESFGYKWAQDRYENMIKLSKISRVNVKEVLAATHRPVSLATAVRAKEAIAKELARDRRSGSSPKQRPNRRTLRD
jgi:hypothetical protein